MQREDGIRFRVLMEASKTVTVLISVKTGAIVTCNRAAEKLLGKTRETLVDASLAEEFESKGREDVVARLVSTASEQSISPVMAKSTQGKRKLSLSPTLFRGANGQMLLCKIRMAGSQETPTGQLQVQQAELYQNSVDAIVFVDAGGNILSSNEAFPKLTDVTHSQSVQSRAIADFFSRGSVDLNVMLENARRTGSM